MDHKNEPILGRFEHWINYSPKKLKVQFVTGELDCPLTDLRLTSNVGDISRLV